MGNSDENDRSRFRGIHRRRFVRAALAGAGLGGISGRSLAQGGTDDTDAAGPPVARHGPFRQSDDETDVLYTYRKRRALEVLLSDPEVHAIAEDMISSYEAYEPYADHLDAISVQGSPDVEIEGGVDEGRFDVTAVGRQVAYGLVDRRTDDLVGLTITEPRDISWRAWEANERETAQLARVLDDSRVQTFIDGTDWFPLFTISASITSARGIEHGGVNPIVLFLADGDSTAAVVAYLDVRDDSGDVVDVSRVDRFVESPPHELAATLTPADDTVVEAVPDVPFEDRPWYTADDGIHRIEDLPTSFERSGWTIDWEPPGRHGVEITASYRGTPVFETLQSPVTLTGYGLPERDGETTLDWFFPDDEPVFNGRLLRWDVHSIEFGGPGPLGVIDYSEGDDRPSGFRFRSHYETGAREPNGQDHHSGYRFGQSSHELSYDFWADGTVTPIWRRQGPGFVTAYAIAGTDDENGTTDDGNGATDAEEAEYGVDHHSVSTFAMDAVPGTTNGVEVGIVDGTERMTPETEFYLSGESGIVVQFTNPEGSEMIELPLDEDVEVVVARRSAGEIPGQQRLEDPEVESAFYHPAQYIGDEPIQGERVVAWLLLEGATAELPHPTGSTSFVTGGAINLSGY
ncbi:hypothetical protein HYG81_14225 [Natrinema zhouii]|uniref:Uncharacterized protein n=1 Tax=Natrinema zhouii TaxID=1710539 RepID=A0A7D6GJG8_9EURY|nr:hypothetical protein [Natrinema zhouii]QLK25239.1 hypothetical protein HYG81_14225 [Natrinema zhouii]